MVSRLTGAQIKEAIYLLKEVSKKQKQLLLKHFDWEKREIIIPNKRKSFFHRKTKEDRSYSLLVNSLEELKEKLRALYGIENGVNEFFWWNLPWESVEPYLIYNLREESSVDQWRYTYNWETIDSEKHKVIVLHEEGHFSNFSSNTYEYKRNESVYSELEQDQMIHDYNKKLDNQARFEMLFDDGTAVQSDIGNIYDSITDYYASWEYWAGRELLNNIYARNLYTEYTTQIKSVVSNSRHYECLFEIGALYFDSQNELDGLSWHPFELKAGCGDIPKNLKEKYRNRDAAVSCAAFICDQNWIQKVPIGLFEGGFIDKDNSIAASLQKSELFTCLSDKLV